MKESASSFGKSRPRRLSEEEIALWLAVAKTVSPRSSSVLPEALSAPFANEVSDDGPPPSPDPNRPTGPARPKQRAADRPKGPPAALERKLRQKLSRGRLAPDAAIDLHGLRRHEAFVALRDFLSHAQRQGATVVLVVTGKGGRGAAQAGGLEDHEAAGVLRRSVPQWLHGPDYHSIIAGFSEASRPHGGEGALYVAPQATAPLARLDRRI